MQNSDDRKPIDLSKLTAAQLDALARRVLALIKQEARKERERQRGR